jgi:hypothetical protein
MAENRFIDPDEFRENEVENNFEKKSDKPRTNPLGGIHLNAYFFFKNIHFIFFLTFLAFIYIANSHHAVSVIKEIRKNQEQLEKTSWMSNATKSKLMYESMQSQVVEKVSHLGLKPMHGKPRKIEVDLKK